MNTDLVIALVFFIVIFCLLAAVNIWKSWSFLGPILCCHMFRPEAKNQFRSKKNEMNQKEYDRIVNKNRMQPEKFKQQYPSSLPQPPNPQQQSQQGGPQQSQQGGAQQSQPNYPQQPQQGVPQQPQPNYPQQPQQGVPQQPQPNQTPQSQQGWPQQSQNGPPQFIPQYSSQPNNQPQPNQGPPNQGLPNQGQPQSTFPNYQQNYQQHISNQPGFQARSWYAPYSASYTTSNKPNDFRVFEEV
jgi:hypothetical protein